MKIRTACIHGELCQTAATGERILANKCHAAWDPHPRQSCACIESPFADGLNAFGERHTCKPTATIERIVADECEAGGKRNARQTRVGIERAFTN